MLCNAGCRHPSHWGKICFLSTPDGENCGLIKNLASTGLVSTSVSDQFLDKLLKCGMEELVDDTSTSLHGKDNIFLDGELVGVCKDSASFVTYLRSMRRRKEIPLQVLFFFSHANFFVFDIFGVKFFCSVFNQDYEPFVIFSKTN